MVYDGCFCPANCSSTCLQAIQKARWEEEEEWQEMEVVFGGPQAHPERQVLVKAHTPVRDQQYRMRYYEKRVRLTSFDDHAVLAV
jgi:hypothetical protein